MSGFVAVFSRDGTPTDEPLLRAMLGRMPGRGADCVGIWTGGPAGIGVARHEWELAAGFSGPVLIVEQDGIVVAADASLYYREELKAALKAAGVVPGGETASHLILAAYRAWGERCAERLEGDFAFVVWDGRTHELFCARDLVGGRPLHYAEVGGTVIVASTLGAVLEHPRCPRGVNLTLLAEQAAGLFFAESETFYEAVATLPVAHSAVFRERATVLRRFWTPPPITPFRGGDFEEGAAELQALLGRAVMERLDPQATTSVLLSGGRDSTAVYGAGMNELRTRGDPRTLQAVSMSYPDGDAGREDEFIEMVVAHWGAGTKWIDIHDVPAVVPQWVEQARESDDAFIHPYESWNRALVAGSRSVGARVALTGYGGDSLFQYSPVYLADLFVRGRWATLANEWRAKGYRGRRPFLRWVIRPLVPAWLAAVAARARGLEEWQHPLERKLAPWVTASWIRARRARETEQRWYREADARSAIAREMLRYFVEPIFPRILADVSRFGLEGGVEVRHPLFERRLIEFAVARPWWELASGPDTKRLLRESMRGLLPEAVLRTRPRRTGSYRFVQRGLRPWLPGAIRAAFRRSRLAELGIVDVAELQRVADRYGSGGDRRRQLQLLWTLRAELWLQGQEEVERARSPQVLAPAGMAHGR